MIKYKKISVKILKEEIRKIIQNMFYKLFKNKEGMSLIEIMVAFTILTTVFIALSQAFPYGLSINKTAENVTLSSYLAQDKIEELHSLGYDNIPLGIIEAKHKLSDIIDDYRYSFERETEVSYVDSDLEDSLIDLGMKKISVTIYYLNSISKNEDSYNITTLISTR